MNPLWIYGAVAVVAFGGGYVACWLRRIFTLVTHPTCGYCNGNGFFANSREAAATDQATLRTSQDFKP